MSIKEESPPMRMFADHRRSPSRTNSYKSQHSGIDSVSSSTSSSTSSIQPGQVGGEERFPPRNRSRSRSLTSLSQIPTRVSEGHDATVEQLTSTIEVPDEAYDRLPPHRKNVIVAVLSFLSFLAPISSTTVLSATPEVAAEYNTTGSIINVSSALYMLFMGISPLFWGPISQVYGRRIVNLSTAALFFLCSIGTALAPNLAAFFIFRLLTAFEGTAFILVGSACLSDIYPPKARGTAMGYFLLGTLIGPAFGPFIGGIIVTYTSWRAIFWLQTGLAGLACILAFFFLPETIYHKRVNDLVGISRSKRVRLIAGMINPIRVLRLYRYPNLVFTSWASSALIWNMYSLLTPIRYVLNPRFGLDTPLEGGLFYLAPGCGYLVGTFFGGRWADHIVKKYIKKRDGVRIPEDRLHSGLPFMGVVIPACILIYGWGIDQNVGGIPLAVVTMFVQGWAQLFCFPSLNAYCLDVMQERGAEVIAGNYFVRYLFACAGTAIVLPAVQSIGVGWFNTISALFLVSGTLATMAAIKWGKGWRESINKRKREKKLKKGAREEEPTIRCEGSPALTGALMVENEKPRKEQPPENPEKRKEVV